MCGIAGFSRLTETTRYMAGFLAAKIHDRGRDSWGATDGTESVRFLGDVYSNWNMGKSIPAHWNRLILHTRAASNRTTITAELTHPYEFTTTDGHQLIGVHNGVLSNHQELNTKYSRDFSVDSMHLFKHLAEGLPMDDIFGWGAIVWTNYNRAASKNVIHFARFNMNDFYVYRLKTGEVVFCSYDAEIKKAAKLAGTDVDIKYLVTEDNWFYVDVDPENPAQDKVYQMTAPMKFGERRQPTQSNVQYYPAASEYYQEQERQSWQHWADSRNPNWRNWRSPSQQSATSTTTPSDKPSKKSSKADIGAIGRVKRENDVCIRCYRKCERKKQLMCEVCDRMFWATEVPTIKDLRKPKQHTQTSNNFGYVKVN